MYFGHVFRAGISGTYFRILFLILFQPQIGLTNISTSYADGILRCMFSRKKTAALASASAGRKKRGTTVDATTYKDMNSDWTLMLAYGSGYSDGTT